MDPCCVRLRYIRTARTWHLSVYQYVSMSVCACLTVCCFVSFLTCKVNLHHDTMWSCTDCFLAQSTQMTTVCSCFVIRLATLAHFCSTNQNLESAVQDARAERDNLVFFKIRAEQMIVKYNSDRAEKSAFKRILGTILTGSTD